MRHRRISPLLYEEEQRGYPYTQLEDATWIRGHLPYMQFTLPYEDCPSILTIWFKQFPWLDRQTIWKTPELWNDTRLNYVMQDVFGAYSGGGPITSDITFNDGSWGFKTSFIFWNDTLIENACRVLPLPELLQPGRPQFSEPLPLKSWTNLERIYNISPDELYLQPQ